MYSRTALIMIQVATYIHCMQVMKIKLESYSSIKGEESDTVGRPPFSTKTIGGFTSNPVDGIELTTVNRHISVHVNMHALSHSIDNSPGHM